MRVGRSKKERYKKLFITKGQNRLNPLKMRKRSVSIGNDRGLAFIKNSFSNIYFEIIVFINELNTRYLNKTVVLKLLKKLFGG